MGAVEPYGRAARATILGVLIALGASRPAVGELGGRDAAEQAAAWWRHGELDAELALQSRHFPRSGQSGQSHWHPSIAAELEWHNRWADDRRSLTLNAFVRLDREDDERTHADLREGFFSSIGENSEWHIGVRQIFWGVTEFKHLVDVINQTDLVEDIDGEDKLGQPMVQWSTTTTWGVFDLFALPGFRERTFAGRDGRLRLPLPLDAGAVRYESGAGRRRIDGALRWSNYAGPLSWALHHFSGTSREPVLEVRQQVDGTLFLAPFYPVIEQTGVDAQLLAGDWAFKLEALRRSGNGQRYRAANLGFERTLVGVFGSRSDLGIVVEYLYDDRGDAARDTLFERDLALGARWALNDVADTQALLGLIWDVKTQEYVVSLEASRQLGVDWSLTLEGRVFGGVSGRGPLEALASLANGDARSAFLQRDDYLQLELTRFF